MVDLQETPATPPEEFGGDPRWGWAIAGWLLIVFGWGVGIVVNLAVHLLAPSGGMRVWWSIWIGSHVGPFAWTTVGIGLAAGAMGVVLLSLSRMAPRGPLVLPGYDYTYGKSP